MIVAFAGSVVSWIAWLFVRLYLDSLTTVLVIEIRRGPAADPTEIMRLGELIEGATRALDVSFIFAFSLLLVAVGLMLYASGEAAGPGTPRGLRRLPEPEKLARHKEEAKKELEAAAQAAEEDRRMRAARERAARDKEEQP